MSGTSSEANEYLALREAKIKRNNEQLQKLGLTKTNNSSRNSTRNKHDHEKDDEGDKEKKTVVSSRTPPPMTLRRSSRKKSAASPSHFMIEAKAEEIPQKKVMKVTSSKETRKRQRPINDNNNSTSTKNSNLEVIQSEIKPGTTRATRIDVKRVLHGDFTYPIFIGHQLSSSGKAAVVEHASLMCRNEFGISFNKYSGVCQWNNEAVFLWVNINAPNADVKNEFFVPNDDDEKNGISNSKNLMQMSWFGGSRMKEESAVIRNLILIGQRAAAASTGNNDGNRILPDDCGIVLWCRLYDDTKNLFEPYVCMGRLSYHSHDPNVHPIKFIWNLDDYDYIRRNQTSFQMFQKFANV